MQNDALEGSSADEGTGSDFGDGWVDYDLGGVVGCSLSVLPTVNVWILSWMWRGRY